MVTTLPYMLDLELLQSKSLNVEGWVAENTRLMNSLVSEAAEILFKTDVDSVTLIEICIEGEVVSMLDLARPNLEEALENNQRNWVEMEEYHKAARSRDLLLELRKNTTP